MERVLFSISDYPITGSHSSYEGVRGMFDGINHDYVFAGLPFSALPHPLCADPADRRKLTDDPVAALCRAGEELGVFVTKVALPAFEAGKTVVLAACWLDLLFALIHANPDLADELARIQRMLLKETLTSRGIPAPRYFLVRGTAADDYRRFRDYYPDKSDIAATAFANYHGQLLGFEDRYFENAGQGECIRLDPSLSPYGRQQRIISFLKEPALEQAA